VQEIAVLLDGSKMAVAAYGGPRPDVAKQFGDPTASKSGWYTELDGSKIASGKHTVSVVATLHDGSKKTLGDVSVSK
jgi:hypothetical protein